MKSTLRTKFILFSMVLITLIMVSVTYLYTIRQLNEKRVTVKAQVQRIARNIATAQLLDRQDWGVYQNYVSQLLPLNTDIIYIAIYDDRNSLRAHALNADWLELDAPIRSSRAEAEIINRLDSGGVARESQDDLLVERVNIMVGNRVLGSVNIGFSVIDINRELRSGILLNMGLGMVFVLIAAAIAAVVSRRLTRPLEKLNQSMHAIMEGGLPEKVTPRTHDEIAELTRSFNQMVEGLREREIIEDLGNELSAAFQLERLSVLVRDRLSNAIGAADARMYLRDSARPGDYREITSIDANRERYPSLQIDGDIADFLLHNRNGFMVFTAPAKILAALRHDRRGDDGLVMPITVKDELLGVIFFALPLSATSYSKKQIHFAHTLAGQAALAIENALLYENLREKERLRRELEIARDVQKKLLPAQMPQVPGFQMDGACLPAREVGGDYFDFFPLMKNLWGVAIADVSGHGASASFYMAEIKGMMLQLTGQHRSPVRLLKELNRQLYHHTDRNVFVTMIYGVLDTAGHTFTFARAGHNPLLKITRNGACELLKPPGIGLGLDNGHVFDKQLRESRITLLPGEMLALFTDGLTESMNTGECFGEQRLVETFSKNHFPHLYQTRQAVFDAVHRFADGDSPHDDMTLVLVRRDT